VLAIVGPTAVGKTAIAVAVCRAIGGEIVSFDSRQVYRGIRIASNAPTRGELRGVRCHMVGVIDPALPVDAARYVAMARPLVEGLLTGQQLPVLTAGTGLYLQALLEDLDLGRVAPVPAQRARLRAEASKDLSRLVARLRRMDPGAAARIDVRNPVRVVRAIELAVASRAPGAEEHRPSRPTAGDSRLRRGSRALAAAKVGLHAPRPLLYSWIEERVDRMLTRGWRVEVERLLADGIDPRSQPFTGIGVGEMADVVLGRRSLADARAAIVKKTRNYAKRQLTWFRADPDVYWIEVTGRNRSDIVEQIASLLQKR
jgi:tRNA dimethylallyltransferase